MNQKYKSKKQNSTKAGKLKENRKSEKQKRGKAE